MKDYILSQLRHCLTGLGGLGGLLAYKHVIDPSDVTAVNGAGASMGAALAVILGAILSRLLITFFGRILPAGAGESGSGSGLVPLLILTAGLVGTLALSSCSPEQLAAARAVPIKACGSWKNGTACYSSKSGIEVDVRADK